MNILDNNGKLTLGQSLTAFDNKYSLTLQKSDGNLVLYEGTTSLWNAGTENKGAQEAIMQTDGNFVIYDGSKNSLWDSGTAGNTGAFLLLTDQGTIVINNGHEVIWTRPQS